MNRLARPLFFTLCLFISCTFGLSQSSPTPQSNRIAARTDLTTRISLNQQAPAWATPANDSGPVSPDTSLQLIVLLNRSPERQAAFTKLLADQQDPASPDYHRWLTPAQVGALYGPTQPDLDAISAWLVSQGLAVTEITPSHVFIDLSAPASAVSRAFGINLRYFSIDGETRFSATSAPSIPAAFANVIHSISGLSETHLQPMSRMHSKPLTSMGVGSDVGPSPDYTSGGSGAHFVTPGDFATIFDVQPTYAAGFTGTGQKVAIIGRSRVVPTDISEFESMTGLPANQPNTVIPANGVDPGIGTIGDQGEATLDVDRVIGTAPGVQADLVVSGSAGGFDGIYVAAQYEVQTLLDPVMNVSFGACEAYAGPGGVSLWDTLFAQAASEGISVFVSSADSGAATCDAQFAPPPAYQFRSINYICASSYATCVGATELADSNLNTTYWSSTNSANLVSALGYIPEGAWNEPQALDANGNQFAVVAAGGGGASIYIPKPSWQTGTGVPADGFRDVPDVSFPGAGHDGYFACFAAGGGDCANKRFEYFDGTSAAAPAMAAVTALLNQKMGTAQGNMNPVFYRTAAATPGAFHDATPSSSGVNGCAIDMPSMCNNSTYGLDGYLLTTGYDQATGLGSLDVTSFLNAVASISVSGTATKLGINESASSIADTGTVTFTATLVATSAASATGTVQFFADGTKLGTPVALAAGVALSPAVPFPAAGSYLITASYSGDSSFQAAVSPGITLQVSGIASQLSLSPASATITSGTLTTFTATVATAPKSVAPTGIVRFLLQQGSATKDLGAMPLSNGVAMTSIAPRPIGSYTISAFYLGDTVYSPSNSSSSIIVQKQTTGVSLFSASPQIGLGGYVNFQILASISPANSSVPPPTGTFQLLSNGSPLGTSITLGQNSFGQATQDEPFSTAGTYSITAAYSGDQYNLPSTSDPVTVTVSPTPAAYQLSVTPASLAINAGLGSGANISITATGGFEGVVTPTCTVKYNGTAAQGTAPVCSIFPTTANLNPSFSFQMLSASINTTARSAQAASTPPPLGSWSGRPLQTLAAIAFVPFLCSCLSRRRRSWRPLLVLLVVAGFVSGCGGSPSATSPANPTPPTPPTTPTGTAAGSYTITIAATTSNPATPVPPPVTIALTVN